MTNPGYGFFSNTTFVQKDFTTQSNSENPTENFQISGELKDSLY